MSNGNVRGEDSREECLDGATRSDRELSANTGEKGRARRTIRVVHEWLLELRGDNVDHCDEEHPEEDRSIWAAAAAPAAMSVSSTRGVRNEEHMGRPVPSTTCRPRILRQRTQPRATQAEELAWLDAEPFRSIE